MKNLEIRKLNLKIERFKKKIKFLNSFILKLKNVFLYIIFYINNNL